MSATKLRGGYYTDPSIARFLAAWAIRRGARTVLEPSCGDGVFFDAAPRSVRFVGFETDPIEARKARQRCANARVHVEDFVAWAVSHDDDPPAFDAVVGNPPFVRYQFLTPAAQRNAERLFARAGLPFTRRTNAWVPFVLGALRRVRAGGRIAMVIPAEILHVLHATALRDELLRRCTEVLVVDPQERWFEDTLQGAVLLLAEKAHDENAHHGTLRIARVSDRTFLDAPAEALRDRTPAVARDELGAKWMTALLDPATRALLRDLATHGALVPFATRASVDVGIVTGANGFFLVNDATARAHGLEPYCRPMFGRSEHVPGVIYDERVRSENLARGAPVHFVDFGRTPRQGLTDGARRYVRRGEREGLAQRYKCRIRSPWYAVPSVYATPIGMLKRSHGFPRLVHNRIGAFTTDTAYRVALRDGAPDAFVAGFVNSATVLSAELEGRHYGGGVLELVPSEIERLLVPRADPPAAHIDALDRAVCDGTHAEAIVAAQDAVVLEPLGITARDAERLRAAWTTLRLRRQRRDVSAEPPTDRADAEDSP